MADFEEVKNFLGLRTQGVNYYDGGFIAVTHHSAIVYIALSNLKIRVIHTFLM
jgi:hypothetical protein